MKNAVLAALFVSVVALAGAACNDDADSNSSASQAEITEVSNRIQRNEMLYALTTLSTLGLHAMDESLAEGTIDSSFARNTRTAIRMFALTNWDATLQEDAETLRGHAVDLLAALNDEDVEAAADAAHELHEGEHDFSDAAWAIVAKDLPPDAGGVEEHEEEPAGTPGAEGTPSASTTEAADDHGEEPTTEATP
jgi:hypothetical protein